MLTEIQKDILIGSLLGDGAIEKSASAGGNARFQILRSIKDINYLEWEYENLKDLCKSGIKYFTDARGFDYCYFKTRSLPVFTEFRNKWYPDGKKIIPKDIELTPLIIAVWLSDDGSTSLTAKKAIRLSFCTDSFTKEDTIHLVKLLEDKYECNFTMYEFRPNQWRIYALHRSAMILLKDIDSVFTFLPRKRDKYKEFLSQTEDELNSGIYSLKKVNSEIDIIKLYNFSLNNNTFDFMKLSRHLVISRKILSDCLNEFVKKLYFTVSNTTNDYRKNVYTITSLGKSIFDTELELNQNKTKQFEKINFEKLNEFLSDKKNLSLKEIKDHFNVEKQQLYNCLKKLIKKDYIKSYKNIYGRYYTITPLGRENIGKESEPTT